MPAWQAFVDGTAAPNPGALGIGVVVTAPDGTRYELSRALGFKGDNNDAEFEAVIAALEVVVDNGATADDVVVVHSDSDVVVSLLSLRKTTVLPRLVTLLERARVAMAAVGSVDVVLVTRLNNSEADVLARTALGLAVKIPRHLRPPKRRR